MTVDLIHEMRRGLYILILAVSGLKAAQPLDEKQLFDRVADAVVTIKHLDRNGDQEGIGTGFVIDSAGRVATSLHVIGEARRVEIILQDGSKYEPTSILGWDRTLDLAVLQIAAENLHAIPLGDSAAVSAGQRVVAVGNPMGLEWSVVGGVVSGVRQFAQGPMIQVAIPIEPGNSGGPLFDTNGNVIGVMNMKSTLTPNLGFATPINGLSRLISRPNSMVWERWLRLGALDEKLWQAGETAMWSSKVGRVAVEGTGKGFGGRSYIHHTLKPNGFPYELETSVRLKDETGAAGLIFGSDGNQTHYGFYPSNGQMRLTRFEGPSVYDWTILDQVNSPYYRPNESNHLRVLHDQNSIRCYLNNELVIESEDRVLGLGTVGLTKFRQTSAEFAGFNLHDPPENHESTIEQNELDPEALVRLLQLARNDSTMEIETSLEETLDATPDALERSASLLDKTSRRLREASSRLHRKQVGRELKQELANKEKDIDLFWAALWVAKHDQPDLDMEAYRAELQRMVDECQEGLAKEATDEQRVTFLMDYLFVDNGYHGSYTDYQHEANSYVNKVLEDREGLPISLSVLTLAMAERLGIEGLEPFPLPGHFMLRQTLSDHQMRLIDVFDGGRFLTYEDANKMLRQRDGSITDSRELKIPSKLEIIQRMLRNLQVFAQQDKGMEASLPYVDLALTLDEQDGQLRMERAFLRLRVGQAQGAKDDLSWLLEFGSDDLPLDRIRELRDSL